MPLSTPVPIIKIPWTVCSKDIKLSMWILVALWAVIQFLYFYFFTCLIFSKFGFMPCEKVLLRWACDWCDVFWEIRDWTTRKKKKIKHSNGFPYCLLIYTEWREDIFTVILKLLNILLPFNISINTALEKCLEKNFGKNGECRLWSRLKLPNTITHQCDPQFVSLPLEWFFKKNLNLRKNTFWIFER